MARVQTMTTTANEARPVVRRIGVADVQDALARGLDDFRAKPSHLLFIAIIYPLCALLLTRYAFGYNILPLLFPMAAGFALIGPFAAIGLYELSRRRERGEEIGWQHAFGVLRSPSIGSILLLGAILFVIFLAWIGAAQAIYLAIFGGERVPGSFGDLTRQVLGTQEGWRLILIGNFVGFLFAVVAFCISVVSFPLLLDRKVSVATAVTTSLRAVWTNPIPMVLWGLIVVVGLVVGSLPFFIGLAVVMPVLGHATWHLYRKVVAD